MIRPFSEETLTHRSSLAPSVFRILNRNGVKKNELWARASKVHLLLLLLLSSDTPPPIFISQPPRAFAAAAAAVVTSLAKVPNFGTRSAAGEKRARTAILRPGVVRAGEEDRGEEEGLNYIQRESEDEGGGSHSRWFGGRKKERAATHSFALLWMRNDPIGLENFTSHTLYVHVCNLRRGPVLGEEVGLLFSSSSSSSSSSFPSQSQ